MEDDKVADDIFSDALELEISEEVVESDDERNKRIVGFVKSCNSGAELFTFCTKSLPNTGMKCRVALTMNRAVKFLSSKKLLDNEEIISVAWRKCHLDLQLKVEPCL